MEWAMHLADRVECFNASSALASASASLRAANCSGYLADSRAQLHRRRDQVSLMRIVSPRSHR